MSGTVGGGGPTNPTTTKRAWKLQEFVAHGAAVNCLALGHKSGRVLVTGGEDKKVNLWAVGKPNCIMSLSGHSTPIESVRFGYTEELVCAGSQSGALKIWDLEAARLVRTLTGHKAGVKCIDFHPYGDFLASGSSDTSLRLWDTRRKGCIFSYKGHTARINSVKFSPDGQWIATAGEEAVVKLWDLRAGKQLTELAGHSAPVTDVEFHPHEFIMASGSEDRTVSMWDLESFAMISGGERERGAVRCIYFHPEGDCLFTGTQDSLKVCGWEPVRTHDTISLGWGKVVDIATASNQLIGASHHGSHVQLWVVDLKKVQPFSGTTVPEKDVPGNVTFRTNQPVRRSFIKEKPVEEGGVKREAQVRIEECSDKSGTDGDESDVASTAEITNLKHYENIFAPRERQLNRTPPIEEPFEAPQEPEQLPQPVRANDPMNFHSNKARPSPAGTRRASQPSLPSAYAAPPQSLGQQSGRRGSSAGLQDVMKPQEVHLRPQPLSGGQRPYSVHEGGRLAPEEPSARAGYRTAVTLGAASGPEQQEYLPQQQHVPQRPYSQSGASSARGYAPATSSPKFPSSPTRDPSQQPGFSQYAAPPSPTKLAHPPSYAPSSSSSRSVGAPLDRPTTVRRAPQEQTPPVQRSPPAKSKSQAQSEAEADPDSIKLVPSMSDKPTGLSAEDFLPETFGKMQLTPSFGWPQTELSESEVTSTIIKGHSNMMAVLSARSRNMAIVRQLWQTKDAKTAVEQAVDFNDPSLIVDLLSVIILRPSIWNLDLCLLLLPTIGQLLLSKYESYVNSSAQALKLILKNFAPVIKSNIDQPSSCVGVDISKEDRARKCMDCYSELVKIRSGILKRQTMQGKAGHAYRELAILMQYLD